MSPIEGVARADNANLSDVRSFLGQAMTHPPTLEKVRAFMLRNGIGDLNDPGDDIADEVCAAKVVEPGAGQEPALVAVIGYHPRNFCETAVVARVAGRAVYVTKVDSLPIYKINTVEGLIPGQTLLEIPDSLTDYAGSRCRSSVVRFYAFSSNTVKDVSAQYPEYYIAALNSFTVGRRTDDPTDPTREADIILCRKIDVAAMQALAGKPVTIQPLADQLSRSADSDMREKAIALFTIAKGATNITKLKAMTHDPAPSVALAAKFALKDLGTYGN
jgi:hypothetical protein